MNHGVLVISIDFELYWGVRDKRSVENYRQNLEGVQQAIPRILELFHTHGIHATWATVGLLFCKDAAEVLGCMPDILPEYENKNLSPYEYLKGTHNVDPVYHFAPHLIELIASSPHQEIATHTFSHYYCLERGQTLAAFKADLQAAIAAARTKGINTHSLVFPRNQWNREHLPTLAELGIRCYRGNEASWFYRPSEDDKDNYFRRLGRLLDTYINLCGHQTYTLAKGPSLKPYDFPSSRLLRPYSRNRALLDGLRLGRIQKSMLHAAKNTQIYHLWWHPHNFGVNTDKNIQFLAKILQDFSRLRENYGMRSFNMGELSQLQESSIG